MNIRLTGNPAKASRIIDRRPITAGETFARALDFDGSGLDDATLVVRATIATPAPVRRRDQRGVYLEILDPHGLAFDKDADWPLLTDHAVSTRSTIGRASGLTIEEDAVKATLRFTAADDALPIRQRVRDGTLKHLSVGYRVQQWCEGTDANGQRTKTAVRWQLLEVTLTPIPADSNARITQRNDNMDPEEIELTTAQRRTEIRAIAKAAGMTADDADDMIDRDLDPVAARAEAFEAMQTRQRSTPRIRVGVSHDDPAAVRDRQSEALACRMMGTTPGEAARPYMQLGLGDYARDHLSRSGVSVATLSREELLTRAMHGTSDFPELLTGAGNRVVANAYQRAASPLKQLARQRTAADFRPMAVLKVGEFSGLSKVSEHGEVKAMSTTEAKEGYSLETFGGIFSLTRKAIINDDLNAFGRWGEMMGQAAAETEANQLLGLLTANSGGGVKLSDTKNLFHADHGNLAASGAAPSDVTLSAARLAMRTQKGLDGTTPVGVTPKYLLVGPALETAAEKLLASIYAASTDDVQPIRLTLIVEPRLTGNAWYVFGDPANAPVLEYAYLSSAQGPQLSSRDGWEVLGREFRVVLDFGCGATDHRGAYRNAGG